MKNRLTVAAYLILAIGLLMAGCRSSEHITRKETPAESAGLARISPRLNAWEILGPGGGGTMIGPTISPHDFNLVLEHCDMTGAYITADGGQSWRMFNLRTVVSSFAFDPVNQEVIYAGNMGLWRSENRGKSWSLIFPDPGKNTRERMSGDHADCSLLSDDPSYPISGQESNIDAIAVDPHNSNNLWIAFSGNRGAGEAALLYASRDRGATWTRSRTLAPEAVRALFLPSNASARSPDLILVVDSGVYLKTGEKWEHRSGPPGSQFLQASVGQSKSGQSSLIYASTPSAWKAGHLAGGLWVSSDSGRNWKQSLAGIAELISNPGKNEPPQFMAVACSSQQASVAYAGFSGLRLGDGPENLFNGIARTMDGGEHWTIVNKESNRPSAAMEGSWFEDRAPDSYPNIWFDSPYSLGVAPTHPEVCYATDLFRTYRTLDGGQSWKQVHSLKVGDNQWTSRGLDVTTCYGVHFDPFNPRHIFISYTDIGLFQSTDGGRSWMGSTLGIPNVWRNTTYWVVLDPEVQDLIWGGFSGTHDLPRPKMWRGRNPEKYTGGVAVSTDGGRHWALSNQGMPETAITHLLMDPRSPRGSRTLYACGFGRGIFKSTDNGRSWIQKNNGIDGRQPFAWRLAQVQDGTLYVVVARRSTGGKFGDAEDGALYRSTDGAETWTRMALPQGTNGPTSLVPDPRRGQRLYLTAWGLDAPGPDTGGGVFLSEDAGKNWRCLFKASQHVYDLTVDPLDPKILYICGFDAAAYRSTDGGSNWSRIRGYNFKWGHRVIPDPVEREKIYITTYGGSVWHGPAAGDTRSEEDILTPLKAE